MMMTTTNVPFSMVKHYDLSSALTALQCEGLLLIPTDTVWSIACDATDRVAIERLRRLGKPSYYRPIEILFADLDQLKAYVDRLHPRLETLLVHHLRPLTIITERALGLPDRVLMPGGALAARLTQDDYCRQLIEALGRPLATLPAAPDEHLPPPAGFGFIRSDVIENVDYVARYRQKDRQADELSVMVKLDDLEELAFIRE